MRNLGLDILRFIAIGLVLGRHLEVVPITGVSFLGVWQTGGWIGVDLFFVLSGFLVSGLIFGEYRKNGTVDLKRFLIRRGLKIYPAFYVLIITTIFVLLINGEPIRKKSILAEVLFIQNYLGGLWGPHWSLAVEEHFYAGIAVFAWFVLRKKEGKSIEAFSTVPVLFGVIAAICLLLRILTAWSLQEYSFERLSFATHVRIDSLMFGVLISYLWHFKNLEARISCVPTWALVAAGLILLSPAFIYELDKYLFVSVVLVIPVYLGSGLLLLAALRWKSSRNPIWLVCGVLGGASYSIYLWHMPVNVWGWPLFSKISGYDSFPVYFCVYIGGALGFGFLMSKAIEWPVLRLRDKLFPARGREIDSAVPAQPLPPDQKRTSLAKVPALPESARTDLENG